MVDKNKSKWSIKGLFVEDTSAPEKIENVTTPVTNASQGIPTSATQLGTKVDDSYLVEKSKKLLLKVLDEKLRTTFDCYKFKKACDSSKGFIPDENTRLLATYATAQSMGITREDLLKSGAKDLADLNFELEKFKSTIDASSDSEIVDSNKRILAINAKLKETTEEITRLNKGMQDLNIELTSLTALVSEKNSKIEIAQQAFTTAYTQVSDEIKDLLNKIQTKIVK